MTEPRRKSETEPVRFLVVEDEPLIGLDLVTLLEDRGYAVIGPVADLAHALAEAELHQPQAAFVDVNLADGPTGPTVATELTQRHGTRCVFLTGNPELASGGAALGLFRKPYRVEAVAVVADWLAALTADPDAPRPGLLEGPSSSAAESS